MNIPRALLPSFLGLFGYLFVQAAVAAPGWVSVSTGKPTCTDLTANRYVDCGDGTVADNSTGLLWLKDAGCIHRTAEWENWDIATIEVQNLADGNCGLTDGSQPGDWRLPTRKEWEDMVADAVNLSCTEPPLTDDSGTACYLAGPGSSFVNIYTGPDFSGYWSATTDETSRTNAYYLNPENGDVSNSNLKSGTFKVWPVRYSQ